MFEKINILGVGITNASEEDILEYLVKICKNGRKKVSVVTPNPEILVYANHHPDFKKVLNSAEVALADGVGVLLASKVLGKGLQGRVTGVDLMEKLCEKSAKRGFVVGFFGGRDGVAEITAECLQKKYPGLKIGFVGEESKSPELVARGPVKGSFPASAPLASLPSAKPDASALSGALKPLPPLAPTTPRRKKSELNFSFLGNGKTPSFYESAVKNRESGKNKNHNSLFIIPNLVDILFVALGFPKQEEWIYKNLPKISASVAMGVGGSFDYISGRVPRAPVIIQNLGLEWLFRLIVQPWRIKRQLALGEFVWLVLKEKFTSSKPAN